MLLLMVPAPAGSTRTFVSYAREDSEIALKLVRDLRKAGANIWLDQTDIPVGNNWPAAVEEALYLCGQFLVILSPDSVQSANVMAELNFALDQGKTILPVLYRECKRPFRIHSFQYADFTADYQIGISTLLTALAIQEKPKSAAPPLDATLQTAESVAPTKDNEHTAEFILAPLSSQAGQAEDAQATYSKPNRQKHLPWLLYLAIVALFVTGLVDLIKMFVGGTGTSTKKTETPTARSPGIVRNPAVTEQAITHILPQARYTPDPARTINTKDRAQGVDVSRYNGSVPWPEVAAAGYSFAIIKATQGSTFVDPQFTRNWSAAKEAGMIRGAYHFFAPAQSGVTQALAFLKVVQPQLGDLPASVDVEQLHTDTAGTSDSDLVFRLSQFLTTVETATGRAPILYTPREFSEQNFRALSSLSNYPLWLAQYSMRDQPNPPSNWHTWAFWQYTNNARIATGIFDVNRFNGTKKDLQNFVGATTR